MGKKRKYGETVRNREQRTPTAVCISLRSISVGSHLLLRRRAELFRLLSGDGSRHVEGLHQLIVPELLVVLKLGDEAV